MSPEEQTRTQFGNAIKLAKRTETIVSTKSLPFKLEGVGRALQYAFMRLHNEGALRQWGRMESHPTGYLSSATGHAHLHALVYRKQENEAVTDLYYCIRGAIAARVNDGKDPDPNRLQEVMDTLTLYMNHYTRIVRLVDMLLSISKHVAVHGSGADVRYPSTRISPTAVFNSRDPNAAARELERYYESRSGQKLAYLVEVLDKPLEMEEQSTRGTYTLVERMKTRVKQSLKKPLSTRRF